MATKDIVVEAVDLSGSQGDAQCGVAFYVAIMSAIQERRLLGGTVVLGDLTIQGNVKPLISLMEPMQLASESGAFRALVPIANKSQFANLPEDVVESVDLVFYGDVDKAVLKSVEV